MQRIEIKSRVGSDGFCTLTSDGRRCQSGGSNHIETIATPEEWARGILETAGTWQGDFETA